jgi:hypothetical protein
MIDGKRMTSFLQLIKVIVNIFLLLWFHSAFAFEELNWQYNDYKISRKSIDDFEDKIIVVKNAKVVFEITGIAKHLYFLNNENPITDITGDGILDMVIEDYSGGAHCCYSATVLELGKKFRTIANLEGGVLPVEFKEIDNKPGSEVIIYDNYAYRWTSFANSAFGKIVLRFQDGSYVVAPDLIRSPPLSQSKIKAIITKIKSNNYSDFRYVADFLNSQKSKKFSDKNINSSAYYFGNIIADVIDLIYSGNYPQAMKIIDETWPGSTKEKIDFKKDLINEVKNRHYGKEVIEMNYAVSNRDSI